ncbi:MAG: hypothetical protein JWQ21_1677, partial [Herminiimonas sp.]|nr:hypothetical protein [Herminiimonas sp.]
MEIKGHRPNQFFRDLLPKPKDARPSAGSVTHALPSASGSGYGAPLMRGQHPATDGYTNLGFIKAKFKFNMGRRSTNTPPVIAHWAQQSVHPPVAFEMPQHQANFLAANANPAFPWMSWDANNVGTPPDRPPPYSPSRQTSAPMANVNQPLPPTSWLPQPGASFYPPMINAHPASPWGPWDTQSGAFYNRVVNNAHTAFPSPPWDTQQHTFGSTTNLGPDSHLLRPWNPPASPGNTPAPYPSIQQEYGHNHGDRESAPPLPPPHLDWSFQSRSSTLARLTMRIPAEPVPASPVSNAADITGTSANPPSPHRWTVQSNTTTTRRSSQWRISTQASINSNAADTINSTPTRLGGESEVVNTEPEEVRYRTADD